MYFEMIERADGKWFWHLRGANNETIFSSEVLENQPEDVVYHVKNGATDAPVYRVRADGSRHQVQLIAAESGEVSVVEGDVAQFDTPTELPPEE